MDRVEQDVALFAMRDLSPDLCLPTPMPVIATPPTLYLAHLRTAHWFHAEERLDRFVTLERAQRDAAQELGLPV